MLKLRDDGHDRWLIAGSLRERPEAERYVGLENEVDWTKTEATLLDEVRRIVAQFVRKHPKETFHGIFVDCNVPYGEVLVHMETTRQLLKRTRG